MCVATVVVSVTTEHSAGLKHLQECLRVGVGEALVVLLERVIEDVVGRVVPVGVCAKVRLALGSDSEFL